MGSICDELLFPSPRASVFFPVKREQSQWRQVALWGQQSIRVIVGSGGYFLLHLNVDRKDAHGPGKEPQEGFGGPVTPGGQGQGGSDVRPAPCGGTSQWGSQEGPEVQEGQASGQPGPGQ